MQQVSCKVIELSLSSVRSRSTVLNRKNVWVSFQDKDLSINSLFFSLHNAFNLCNCDDLNTDAYDEGVITNMEHLPVMRLNYGDSGKRYAWIEYNLGPFVCSGKDYLYPSDVLYSDFYFKAAFNESRYFHAQMAI